MKNLKKAVLLACASTTCAVAQAAPFEVYDAVFRSGQVLKTLEHFKDNYGLDGAYFVQDFPAGSIQIKLTETSPGPRPVSFTVTVTASLDRNDSSGNYKVDGFTYEPVEPFPGFVAIPIDYYKTAINSKRVKDAAAGLAARDFVDITFVGPFDPRGVRGTLFFYYAAGPVISVTFDKVDGHAHVATVTTY